MSQDQSTRPKMDDRTFNRKMKQMMYCIHLAVKGEYVLGSDDEDCLPHFHPEDRDKVVRHVVNELRRTYLKPSKQKKVDVTVGKPEPI